MSFYFHFKPFLFPPFFTLFNAKNPIHEIFLWYPLSPQKILCKKLSAEGGWGGVPLWRTKFAKQYLKGSLRTGAWTPTHILGQLSKKLPLLPLAPKNQQYLGPYTITYYTYSHSMEKWSDMTPAPPLSITYFM